MKTETLKNIFKILIILILTLIIGVIVHTLRNYIIVSDLEKKISKFESSTNFNLKAVNNYTNVRMDYYKKDDNELSIIEKNVNGNVIKLSYYKNKNEIEQLIDDKDNNKKILRKNETGMFKPNIDNCLITENNFQKIFACFSASIKETEYNGKKCYIINNFTSPSYLYSKGKNEFYIEKETGLILKRETESPIQTIEYAYEFDNVKDEVFIRPNVSEYEVE